MKGMDFRIPFVKSPPRVAVIRLQGMIASGRGGGLNDAGIGPVIERAFAKGKPVAVALVVNSPGGSPVQSSLIGARIRRLAEEKKVPVHAFCEDVAASGGYWLATAADDIWVDANSVVGSIGSRASIASTRRRAFRRNTPTSFSGVDAASLTSPSGPPVADGSAFDLSNRLARTT